MGFKLFLYKVADVCPDRNHFDRLFHTYGRINIQLPCPVLLREQTEKSLADPNAPVGTHYRGVELVRD